MADFIITLLGVFGNAISAAFFLSPVNKFWRIWKDQSSTDEIDYVPYVCTLLSTTLWTYYGYITGQVFIVVINGLGFCTQGFYVATFLFNGSNPVIQDDVLVLVVNMWIPVILIVSSIAFGGETRGSLWLGGVCALLTAIMYLSSLRNMITACRTRSLEFLPFWTLVFAFVNSMIWSLYGLINDDRSIQAANGVGILTGILQLIVYSCIENHQSTVEAEA